MTQETTMSLTDEMMRIAREAAVPSHKGYEDHIRSGKADDWITVRSAMRAIQAMHSASPTDNDVERACRAFEEKARQLYTERGVVDTGPDIDEMDEESRSDFYACIGAALQAIRGTDEGLVERLRRELLAALSISHASRFHSAEMTEGVKATVEYLANSFRLEDDPKIREALSNHQGYVG